MTKSEKAGDGIDNLRALVYRFLELSILSRVDILHDLGLLKRSHYLYTDSFFKKAFKIIREKGLVKDLEAAIKKAEFRRSEGKEGKGESDG